MAQSPRTGRLKHLYLAISGESGNAVYVPHLYLEARVDFADVRSGLNETCTVSRALPIRNFDPEDAWTEDMLLPVDPNRIRTTPPENAVLQPSPEWFRPESVSGLEGQFLEVMLRSFYVTLFRNFDLGEYSRRSESLDDFRQRCVEMLIEPFRRDLDLLHEQYDRALEQIREKYLTEDEWGAFDRSRVAAQHRGEFRDVAERITSLFMETGLTLTPQDLDREYRPPSGTELQQRLRSLEEDARHATRKLMATYQQKASNIDEYIIHPNFRDIHLVRSCLLWMPGEAP